MFWNIKFKIVLCNVLDISLQKLELFWQTNYLLIREDRVNLFGPTKWKGIWQYALPYLPGLLVCLFL